VTATDSDGTTAKRSVSYTVTASVVDDPTPLKITGLKQSRAKWRRRVGTTFSFRLNQPAGVTLRFTRRGRGAGTLKRVSRPGANHVRFKGRISRKRQLRPGRYALRVTATNAAGGRSTSRALRFTIRPGGR
jgi:hypothetical protein